MQFDYPKIELHIHLEGTISFQRLQKLYASKGGSLPSIISQGFPSQYPTFNTFVQTYYACCQPVESESDFSHYIAALAEYVKQNNLAYAEISWTPFFYMNKGLSFTKMLGSMNEALEIQNIRSHIRFIIDVQRDHGNEIMDEVFSQVQELRDFQIAGIGMTGDENQPIPQRAVYWFERLKAEQNLGSTVHCGEYGSAQKMQEVIEILKPDRLGHGINAIHSETLLVDIKQKRIHLENCPTSNVKLHRVANYEEHPLKHFLEKGISVSINADDPGIFEMPLQQEIETMAEVAGLTYTDLQVLNQNAIEAAFITSEEKDTLKTKLENYHAQ
jgi:adenosine deaminase